MARMSGTVCCNLDSEVQNEFEESAARKPVKEASDLLLCALKAVHLRLCVIFGIWLAVLLGV